MHKETKMTMIPQRVKTSVWFRDFKSCIVCGQYVDISQANSHVVRRARGGMGIEQNIVTHCYSCHRAYDSYDGATVKKTMDYIEKIYPGWDETRVTYSKYGQNSY